MMQDTVSKFGQWIYDESGHDNGTLEHDTFIIQPQGRHKKSSKFELPEVIYLSYLERALNLILVQPSNQRAMLQRIKFLTVTETIQAFIENQRPYRDTNIW